MRESNPHKMSLDVTQALYQIELIAEQSGRRESNPQYSWTRTRRLTIKPSPRSHRRESNPLNADMSRASDLQSVRIAEPGVEPRPVTGYEPVATPILPAPR